ncbi:MAG: hypothetical protein ABFS32_11820 [Bacteroidota bacterium]
MFKRIVLYSLFAVLSTSIFAQELTIEGVYRGRDIYIQNPYVNVEGGTFCINSISINGEKKIEDPTTSAVKVSLSHLTIDAPVSIVIRHSSLCTPKILNPEVLNTGSSFQYIQVTTDDSSISWVTTGEMPGDGKYFIEKLKLDGWQVVSVVPGKGNLDNNQYSIGVEHYAGDNRLRIRYVLGMQEVTSDEIDFYSDMDPIFIYPEGDVYDMISLTRPTDYVIKDFDGNLLMKGEGQDINVEQLPYGEFIIIIENREENFFRPEPEIIIRPKKKSKRKKRN